MVWPIVVGMVGAAVASGLLQYRNSAAARGAAQSELDRLDDLIDKVQKPDFDMSTLKPEEFQMIQQYSPEIAPYVAEQAPNLVKESGEALEGKQAQLNALRRLSGISEQTQDPELMAQLNQANRRAQAEAQARQGAVIQDAQRRGMMGSGLAMAMQGQAGASAMDTAAQQSQQAAAEAYRNRLNALSQSAQLGGQVRGQETDLAARNAAIMNAFNERTAANRNAYEQYKSGLLNQAQSLNLGTAQDLANRNVQARNEAIAMNQNNLNKLRQQQFENEMNKVGGKVNLGQTDIAGIYGTAAAQNKAIQGIGEGAIGGLKYWGSQSEDKDKENE